MGRLAVVAIGGNSLIKSEGQSTVPDQFAAMRETAVHITRMISQDWDVVITHGNGPQVGFILLRSEIASRELHRVPLDSCGADTQGALGYMIQQCLQNEFRAQGVHRQAVSVVTQVVVDRADPAFLKPTKPIGPFFDQQLAQQYQRERGWSVVEDSGRGWRRVVASPQPVQIVERDAIGSLAKAGYVVVCVGGGGIPVVCDETGRLQGVEAVIDKDRASALLALSIKADLFLITTAVPQVAVNYGQPDQKYLDAMTASEARSYLAAGQFPPGSMGPKIQSCIQFVEGGGPEAIVTSTENIQAALAGHAGTRMTT